MRIVLHIAPVENVENAEKMAVPELLLLRASNTGAK